jgi:hypothetical protein
MIDRYGFIKGFNLSEVAEFVRMEFNKREDPVCCSHLSILGSFISINIVLNDCNMILKDTNELF